MEAATKAKSARAAFDKAQKDLGADLLTVVKLETHELDLVDSDANKGGDASAVASHAKKSKKHKGTPKPSRSPSPSRSSSAKSSRHIGMLIM